MSFNITNNQPRMLSCSRDFPLSGPISVACDNKAALALCKNCKEGQRSKHIDVIHHFARYHVITGELDFVYCISESNMIVLQ
jgi:hypothetical protein